ncbi:hypothetical protein [Burkholderia sp.]|uniref:hypothetical protein n=1 Tax=Burkholderia sp. TaxID=36773 RepID=UPI0025869924|nr:hypothetical protein [Burkholderia sp.]
MNLSRGGAAPAAGARCRAHAGCHARASQFLIRISELSKATQSEMICVIGKKENREINKISKFAIYQRIFILMKCAIASSR